MVMFKFKLHFPKKSVTGSKNRIPRFTFTLHFTDLMRNNLFQPKIEQFLLEN